MTGSLCALRVPLATVVVLALGSCGGGNAVKTKSGSGNGAINGIVVQAVVSGATVTAYKLDTAMARGAVLGTTTTADGTNGGAAAGTFQLSIGPYNGPLELVASAGTYTDESTGVLTQMAGYDISAVLGNYQSGSTISVTISPVSAIAAAFARFDVKAHGTAVATAVDTAFTHLNAHFGGVDWRTVVPDDLATVTNLTSAATAGLVLAALSEEASEISKNTGGTAGVSITAAILAQTLAQDAATGVLDGLGPSGQLTLGTLANSYQPDGKTARYFLATSMLDFLQAHPSLSGITTSVNTIANAISANSDPYLFNSPGLRLNTAPPPVTLVSPGSGAGPYYVNTSSATIAATATAMGNGVAGVYAVVQSSGTPIAATYTASSNPAVWQVQVPLTSGANLVKLYATDNAGQGGPTNCVNAGSGAPSNCVTLTIVQDTANPTIFVSAVAPATYYDESSMTVGATVPPVYSYPNGAVPHILQSGSAVYKAATRIAPVATKGAPDLENGNPDNLPWLQLGVTLTGAPIAAASFSITATSGSSTNTYSGDLGPWLSPTSSAAATTGTIYYDLPLDSLRIPSLTSALGSTVLSVTAAATDAAGNTGTSPPVSVTYYVIGPPLNVALDNSYPGPNPPPNSTNYYTIGNTNYGTLFSTSPVAAFDNGQVRLLRYIVTNPAAQPVALEIPNFSNGSSWAMTESWAGQMSGPQGTIVFNNSTCPGNNSCAAQHYSMYTPPAGSTGCNNDPTASGFNWNGNVSTSGISTLAYAFQNGSDGYSALSNGRYVVPAASGSTPGVIAVYLTRPLAVSRAIPLGAAPYQNGEGQVYLYASQWNNTIGCCASGYLSTNYWECYTGGIGGTSYCSTTPCVGASCTGGTSAPYGTFCTTPNCSAPGGWSYCGATPSPKTCTNCTGTCACSAWTQAQTYNVYSYYQQLSKASDVVNGLFTPVTYGSDSQGNVYGSPSGGATSIAISASAPH